MKKFILFIFAVGLFNYAVAQQTYWQQQVNCSIDVVLNDNEHTLDGFEKIEYINNSPDTLHFIWFHIWPNAYKNDKTDFSEHILENGKTDFYFSSKDEKGYINRLDFKVNNITAQTEDHPGHIDIIKVILPSPSCPARELPLQHRFMLSFRIIFPEVVMMVRVTRQHSGIPNQRCTIKMAGTLCLISTRVSSTANLATIK